MKKVLGEMNFDIFVVVEDVLLKFEAFDFLLGGLGFELLESDGEGLLVGRDVVGDLRLFGFGVGVDEGNVEVGIDEVDIFGGVNGVVREQLWFFW
jgi:hypothetical protein